MNETASETLARYRYTLTNMKNKKSPMYKHIRDKGIALKKRANSLKKTMEK